MKRIGWTALALLFTLTSCGLARDPRATPRPAKRSTPTPALPAPPQTVEPAPPVLNVRYSDEETKVPNLLSLDIYPTSEKDQPVIIFVHGGGWTNGDKFPADAKPAAFNARGWVFASVNYRLLPEVDVIQQVKDVARSIAWAKQNIAQYGGDPARLFLMGHSAGAHLVSLIGVDETYLRGAGLSFGDIRGIVSLDTQTYNMAKLMSNLEPGRGGVYYNAFGDDPKHWKRMSPQTYVEAGKDIPPFAIIYTKSEGLGGRFSKQFYASLQKADVHSVLIPALEETHWEANENFGLPNDRVSDIVFRWLGELLKEP